MSRGIAAHEISYQDFDQGLCYFGHEIIMLIRVSVTRSPTKRTSMSSTHSPATRNIDQLVLSHLRVGQGVSRVELARQLSIAPSTVGSYVDRLVRTGLLRERRGETASAGRPPTIVQLNPEAGQFIGIDLDAREVYGTSVDFAQRLLRDRTEMIGTRESAKEVIDRIGRVIEDVRDQSRDLLGIGIAVPGTVDIATGRVIHYRHIPNWKNISLADEISSRFGVPVRIENNMRAMAFAERCFGQAKTTDDFVCLGVRSGIGAGIFIGGQIHRGSNGSAGEIGIWPCESFGQNGDPESSTCTLEEVASLRAILERLARGARDKRGTSLKLVRSRVTMDELFMAIESGDRFVLRTLREAASVIGRAVAQMSLVIDPEQIIVSGPLASVDQAFVAPLRDAVEDSLARHDSRVPTVLASQLGSLAGALGAATLAIESWQPNHQSANTES